jgi:hypothetical protein
MRPLFTGVPRVPQPNIVTITASAPAVVISERIVDGGRERFENGRDPLNPGEPQSFVLHAGQSVRVVDAAPAAAEAANA